MKRIINSKLYSLLTIISTLFLIFLNSCSESTSNKTSEIYKDIQTNPSSGPISVKKYDVPANFSSEVTAELGGDGFEEIAESLGYETNIDFIPDGDKRAKKGGKIISNYGQYPNTLRTYGKDSGYSGIQSINMKVYETLLQMDYRRMKFRPGLASHWKISEDKRTFWLRINPKSKWSDGKPVTTKDIIATYKLLINKEILAPYTNEYYNKFEIPVAESRYVIRVKTKELNWRLVNSFARGMLILPAHYLDKTDGKGYLKKFQFKMMPGSGPYIINDDKTKKGSILVFQRRSDYWGYEEKGNIGKFNFDELINVMIFDDSLEKEKFKKGELDYYPIGRAQWWVNEFDGNRQNKNPNFSYLHRGLIKRNKIFNFDSKSFVGIAFNLRKPPFDDIRIRKAFNMLFNRKQLINKLFFDEYFKTRSRFSGSIYENPDNYKLDYNPKRANELLDEAGWSTKNSEGIRTNRNGELFEVDFPIPQSYERFYTPFQEELRKAGVKLDLKITDGNTINKIQQERRFKMIDAGFMESPFPNPDARYHSRTADMENTGNFSGIKNDRIDEICNEYFKMFDGQERIEAMKEIDKILSEIVDYIYKWHSPYYTRLAYWDKFGMPESIVSYIINGDKNGIEDIWWYEPEKDKIIKEAMKDKTIILDNTYEIEVDFFGAKKK